MSAATIDRLLLVDQFSIARVDNRSNPSPKDNRITLCAVEGKQGNNKAEPNCTSAHSGWDISAVAPQGSNPGVECLPPPTKLV